MVETIIKIFEKIFAIYSLFLIIFGTIANLFSIFVCLSQSLVKTPTFIFLTFMLISDTISLYFWNLNHFVYVYFGYVFESFGIEMCKFFFIAQLITLQNSAWLLVRTYYNNFFLM